MQTKTNEMLKAAVKYKLGLAILAVLIATVSGVSFLAFNEIQAQNKEKIAEELIGLKTSVRNRKILLSMNTYAGPDCDKDKAALAQARQQLQQFEKEHPNAEADLEAYLTKTGLIGNQQYLFQHGLAYDASEERQQVLAREQQRAASMLYIPGFVSSSAPIKVSHPKYCR